MCANNQSFPLPLKHGPVTAIGDDLFLVRGTMRMSRFMTISRNMCVVRHEGALTLLNAIRLNPAGEASLSALGTVKHVVRLGPFHGMDDPYYVSQYGAEFWSQPGGKAYSVPDIDHELATNAPLPVPDAELLAFDNTKQPESVMLIKRGKGTLVTCDSIQHYGDYQYQNLLARLVMPFVGFPRKTIVGPIWLKYMTRKGQSLRADMERLLGLDFDRLLASHGSFLESNAKESVRDAIQRAFD